VSDVRAVALDSLHEDPANARRHGATNVDAIRASLRQFGQVEPLVVQKGSGRVIGGNGRLAVMRSLGWSECRVVEVDCDDMTAVSLAIVLNRTAELAEWDRDALSAILREVEAGDEDVQRMLDELAKETGITPAEPAEVGPPAEFGEYGEGIETQYRCPKCAYEWSGQPK
jgi:ParB-like chromosome segregation protein Spo0J